MTKTRGGLLFGGHGNWGGGMVPSSSPSFTGPANPFCPRFVASRLDQRAGSESGHIPPSYMNKAEFDLLVIAGQARFQNA